MEEKKLRNQECYDKQGNFLGWFSRSVAVAVFIFRKKEDKLQVLLEKRGKGAADNIGKYCSVCGYLDYNENLTDAVARESFEEVAFRINTNKLKFLKINSDPSENHQNVTVHYAYFADETEDFNLANAKGGEKDEVESAEWFEIGEFTDEYTLAVDIYRMMEKDFAFGHEKIIIDILSEMYDLTYRKH